jgi:Tol biopolymer transport system component
MPVVANEASLYGYEAENRHFVRVFQGKESPRLTFDDGVQIGATWSPDGRKILFDRLSFANGDFEGSVAVMNADGTGSTTILVGDGLQNPDWGSLPIGP